MARGPYPGAFVCSLDFELIWGVRDHCPADGGAYRENLLGARRAIPALLDLFERHRVSATWAVVGFLFATSREEMQAFSPPVRPAYERAGLSPYSDPVGRDERRDPLRFAASLVDEIRRRPGQEIGSHTFSHYYCLEPGQTREAFAADVEAAVRIAEARGIRLRSLVFPRNQLNPSYLPLLKSAGIVAVRGIERTWPYRAAHSSGDGIRSTARRAARLSDAYVGFSGSNAIRWEDIPHASGVCNVASSVFMRPYSPAMRSLERLRLRRITTALRSAAESGRVFHLWWHPHNFGLNLAENIAFLEAILRVFAECRSRWGTESMSMGKVASVLGY